MTNSVTIDTMFYINLCIFFTIAYVIYTRKIHNIFLYISLAFYIGFLIYLKVISDRNILYYQNGLYLFILLISILEKFLTYSSETDKKIKNNFS